MSRTPDNKLEALGRDVDRLKASYEAAKERTSGRKADKDRAYSEVAWCKSEIAQLKRCIGEEHQMARDCHAARDFIDARAHSSNARIMKPRLDALYASRDRAWAEFESYRNAFSAALEEQRRIKGQLDTARAAFQERLAELKEQHASESAKWHDRSCRLCGATFRYHEDWKKVPDLCPSCRESEKAKWQEKPCKSCGSPVRYRADWTRIPELCKQCQERERAKWSERPCKGCGRPIRYNIEWAHPPNYCKSCKEGFVATAGKSGTPRRTS